MKILLVEDEEGLIVTLTDRLRSEGFVVESASDGASGYEIAAAQKFDLIILDVMLPGETGLTLCRWLRTKSKVPVVMLTHEARERDMRAALAKIDRLREVAAATVMIRVEGSPA